MVLRLLEHEYVDALAVPALKGELGFDGTATLYRLKRRAKRRRTCHESAVTINVQKIANTKSTPATVVSAGPSAVNANQARSAAPATEGAFMMTAAAQIHPGRAKEAALRIRCSAWLLTS